MSLRVIILRNLKKNIKNYYLYVFALIFSVALYFSFVTLQFNPSIDVLEGTIKGGAAIGASSVLLVVIVAVFLLYANTIFIKRRSKEIGLFQLVGLTKGKIFQILTFENLMLYFGSMAVGIFAGFAVSRLILMILLKILQVDAIVGLSFSPQALVQTVIVFSGIYLLIMLMNYLFIKGQSILSLFRVVSLAQQRVEKLSVWSILMGVAGIALILLGYQVSSQLFSGKFTDMAQLMGAMLFILGSVIAGTYFFYKGSVSFIFNLIRRSKRGYLTIKEVLSLSSIMFRMKSNALLLTVITTLSALAIGMLSLSYISYYSAASMAKNNVPNDFSFYESELLDKFTAVLESEGIAYKENVLEPVWVSMDAESFINKDLLDIQSDTLNVAVLGDSAIGEDIQAGEALFRGLDKRFMSIIQMDTLDSITLLTAEKSYPFDVVGMDKETVLPPRFNFSFPVVIVDESIYQELKVGGSPDQEFTVYYGVDITDRSQLKNANEAFAGMNSFKDEYGANSQYEYEMGQRANFGLIMFIVGFLGLTFLVTSGCILYFKQMDESEEERPGYTILRKLGFTQDDLVGGIRYKQLFNFGIPLVIGLSHSYFAVKSGWFLFGTEMLAPMLLVMLLYTVLYSIFGLLSVLYYKRVVKDSI
ncbi:FtsX-like permease family protein [Paenibacillus apis]|uniref:Bacitracin export permease protein BceB n=1 Tax=Paenibacillus apis TaxID=1792174 RepID=A0A919Y919_9BACL|nr:FtsX-like permease family protein [Paenibacillus apis]GIO44600.1 bacitracin export permease protein BceB [Paenibacillus apis]